MRTVLTAGLDIVVYLFFAAVSLAVPVLLVIALFKYITG